MTTSTSKSAPGWLVAVTLLLFTVWSNTFIAFSYLLGNEAAAARFDWLSLTVARFVPAALIAAGYCFGLRRRESIAVIREHWGRLLVCGAFCVPAYNCSLYYGQQHGVPAPIASVTTTLVPLFVMVLAAIFLGERLTARRIAGFVVSFAGIVVISLAKQSDQVAYPLIVAITALAPLSWSLFTVISKPVTARVSPVIWTFLSIAVGSVPLLAVLPFSGGPEMLRLDTIGWLSLGYLFLLATVLGFVLWTWLLERLPASTVGLTVFLNPPLTTLFKFLLALALPATFTFTIVTQEWLGGGLVLVGLAIALVRRTARKAATA